MRGWGTGFLVIGLYCVAISPLNAQTGGEQEREMLPRVQTESARSADTVAVESSTDDRGFPLEWIEKAERRWSFPGKIREHLLGEKHGFTEEQLAGLTDEQLVHLHSNHHIHEMIPVGRRVLHPELYADEPVACAPTGSSSPERVPLKSSESPLRGSGEMQAATAHGKNTAYMVEPARDGNRMAKSVEPHTQPSNRNVASIPRTSQKPQRRQGIRAR